MKKKTAKPETKKAKSKKASTAIHTVPTVHMVHAEIFMKYARHLIDCELYTGHVRNDCSCGLQKIFDGLTEA
jgi:hypothetical protein